MKSKVLQSYIQQGEGHNLEFKEAIDKSLAKEMCAFANANGGRILLGVSDNGEIKGINDANRISSQVQSMARDLDPSHSVEIRRIGKVLVVTISEGQDKPYAAGGKYYLRIGSNSQQLKRNEIREFFQKEGLVLFDEKLNQSFKINTDFNQAAFRKFLKLSQISTDINRKHVLDNLDLLEGRRLKNAGVLLFCKKITKHLRQATISCSVFQGKDKYKVIDSKEFTKDIYSNYWDALNYIKSKLNTEYIIRGGPREEVLELPEEVLREVLVNAITHRNYFLTANVQVHIFSNRVEFVSPGGLVAGMKFSDLGKKSMPRNILLFGLLQRMDLVERIGSGMLRMDRAMRDYKLPKPKIDVDNDWFTVILKRPNLQQQSFEQRIKPGITEVSRGGTREKIREKSTEKVRRKYGENAEKIISIISEDVFIRTQDLAKKAHLSSSGVEKIIRNLKKARILKRIGPDKGGHWEVR